MNRFIRSYGKYIVILFLIAVAGNVLLYFSYQHLKKEVIDGLNARQMIHAKQAAKGIETFFIDHINVLQNYSKNENIVNFGEAGKQVMREYLFAHGEETSIIARMDSRGRIIHAEPYNKKVIGQPVTKMEDFLKVRRSHQVVVSDVFTNRRGFKSIIIHAAVFKNGHFDGTLAMLVSFEFIAKRYIDDIRIGTEGYAWIVSRNGIELSCPIPGHVGNSVFDNNREFPDVIAMANMMIKGDQGVATYLYDRIRGRIVSKTIKHAVFMPIYFGDNFWSIVVSTPEYEVTGVLIAFRNRLLLIAILLLIGVGFFFYMLIKTSIVVKEVDLRRKSEEALRESEEKHRQLIENSHDIIYMLTADGIFTYVSPVWTVLLGHPVTLVTGHSFQEFVHPDDIPGCMVWLQKVIETGKRQDCVEYRVQHINGTWYWHTSSAVPLKDETGTITGFEGNARDITERKQAEAEKEEIEAQNRQLQKSESLGLMAGAIAHHFNNQLSVVIGNLELALMEVSKGVQSKAHLTAAMKSSCKAAEMSRLMLTYLGQSLDKREALDLADTCLLDLPLLQAVMPVNVLLDTDLPLPGPTVKANANQMQQVLTNLITNAREATEEGGGVTSLRVKQMSAAEIPSKNRFPVDFQSQDNAYACLEVADTGCGIEANDIEKLFDPFFSTRFTGRGMGLAVVLGIVKAHKGVITVESELKRGSIFRVFFPVSTEEVVRTTQKAEKKDDTGISASSPINLKEGGKVLLVEDEKMVREMAATMLEGLGFSVLEAKDGIEALEVFGQNQADICFVLTDLTMPRMSGWATLTALRKLKPGIPVILASGYDKAHVMEGDHPELPQAFLAKPYNLKALSSAIGVAMGIRDKNQL